MISHKHKCIFVHIPKCAGTSIEMLLEPDVMVNTPLGRKHLFGIDDSPPSGPIVLQHLTADQVKNRIENHVYNEYFKFTFVRNPYAKCFSEYQWWLDHGATSKISFKEWLVNHLKPYMGFDTFMFYGHNKPQHEFIYNNHGKLLVDYVGRVENLQNDLNHICDQLQIDYFKTSWDQRSKKDSSQYHQYYDDESREIVEHIYKKDFEYFGYEF